MTSPSRSNHIAYHPSSPASPRPLQVADSNQGGEQGSCELAPVNPEVGCQEKDSSLTQTGPTESRDDERVSEHPLSITNRNPNELLTGIDSLPVELLSTIFQFTCQFPQPSQTGFLESNWEYRLGDNIPQVSIASALVLSGVSCHWREVVLSTPTLWKTLRISPRSYRAESCANLLRLCIDRSPSPIDLLLEFDELTYSTPANTLFHPDAPDVKLDQLEWTVFVEYPHAIRKLSLMFGDTMKRWAVLALELSPFTAIEEFSLEGSNVEQTLDEYIFIDLSKFRGACGSRLTVLYLDDCPYDLCLALFFSCPNLVRCRCSSITSPSEFSDHLEAQNGAVVFPRLELLDWTAMPIQGILRFGEISIPAVRGIRWHDDMVWEDLGIPPGIPAALVRFLSSAEMMTELELTLLTPHLQCLPKLFAAVPRVQKLTLNGGRHQLPTPSPLIEPLKKRGLVTPLPALQTLVLRIRPTISRFGGTIRSVDVTGDLLETVAQRWELRLVHAFCIRLGFRQTWEERVQEGFKELAREGLQLELLMQTRRVEWL